MPPPVKSVDAWLKAYSAGDTAGMAAQTTVADRVLLVEALTPTEPPSLLSAALMPQPVAYEIDEIVEKAPQRQVIAVILTTRNPLAQTSERIGQPLRGLPRTRTVRERLLTVEFEPGTWGVQLDLARVKARLQLSNEVLSMIAEGRLSEAKAKLQAGVPPLPDDGRMKSSDRLVEELNRRIAAKTQTSTS